MLSPGTKTTEQLRPATPRWEVRESREVYSNGFFRLRRDQCALRQRPLVTADLYVLEMPDCVSVVPFTADGRIVLIEQYRHGVGDWMLECPGGGVTEGIEGPANAARRELLEETGYGCGELVPLGAHPLNPSGQTSVVHYFLARECRALQTAKLDQFEDVRLRLVTRQELATLMRTGAKFQTSTLASLMLALGYLEATANSGVGDNCYSVVTDLRFDPGAISAGTFFY